MRYPCVVVALFSGILGAGIASPQALPSDLVTYLNLSPAQAESINTLNTAFNRYLGSQQEQFYDLQVQANTELAKASPDPGVVGNLYGQMVMIGRDYNTQLAQLQSSVAAMLTNNQVTLVNGLLQVARLQALVSEAQGVYLEAVGKSGDFLLDGDFSELNVGDCCGYAEVPIALVNYLGLSDSQVSAIQNAIQANQNYVSGQELQISELQYAIQGLIAAPTIDTATLGADYVQIAQIQNAEVTQTTQLVTTVRGVITDPQQSLLATLDNALAQSRLEEEATYSNILVLPADLAGSYSPFSF